MSTPQQQQALSIPNVWRSLMVALVGNGPGTTSNVGYAVGANQARRALHQFMRTH